MIKNIFTILQIVTSLLLIFLILIQPKGEGFSSSSIIGQGFYPTRRGFEKILFSLTIFLIIIFFILSLVNFLLR